MAGVLERPEPPPAQVRSAIRDLLTASAQYQSLDPPTRREIAQGLVTIGSAALALATESAAATGADRPRPALARAQSAGSEFSGVAAQRVAGTTREILNAVSFPRFVSELITGVFKALVDTNQQQLHSYVDLIRNVAATTEGFADANVGVGGARQWLAERFPGAFVVEGESDPFAEPGQTPAPEEQAEREAETRLRLRPGTSMPSEGALRAALGLEAQEALPGGDPESLVPLARASLARNRQQMLSTMVMLGLQRIVIDSGRLHASMRFHIDTRSAAADDRGSSFDLHNEVDASGHLSVGIWGMDARVKNTIGYVSTQRTQTTEEMNTDLDLNSSVELVFKTDYLPLERLAGQGAIDRIRVNTLNPEAEARLATEERSARRTAQTQAETARRGELNQRLAPPAAPPTAGPSPPSPPAAPSGPAPPAGGTTSGPTPHHGTDAAPAGRGPNASPTASSGPQVRGSGPA